MKSNTHFKSMMGLTQEEMAAVLGVTASQWSMYKSGQRDLPLKAKKQLASILLHLQDAKTASREKQEFLAAEQQQKQQWLEQEQRNLQYKKESLDRKRRAIESKRAECFAALELVSFLETQSVQAPPILLEDIKDRAMNTLISYSLCHLEALQMKEEHLDLMKNSLEQKINKIPAVITVPKKA
jgi:transcriptional regulator with XRE-family HTH domain